MSSTARALISGVKKHRSTWPMECPSTLIPVGVPRTWNPWCGFPTSCSPNPLRTLPGTQIWEWTHQRPTCVASSDAVLHKGRHRVAYTFLTSTERRHNAAKDGPHWSVSIDRLAINIFSNIYNVSTTSHVQIAMHLHGLLQHGLCIL